MVMGRCTRSFILLAVFCLQNYLRAGNALTIQTCNNCTLDLATCFASNGLSTGFEGCSELCSGISGNEVCVVDNTVHTCESHTCDNPIPGANFTLYRKSTSSDCPKYTIDYIYGHKGLCDVITNATGVTSSSECVIACLDMDGCRGFTYNNTGGVCEFHNCTDSVDVSSTEVAFFTRICEAPGQGCSLAGIRTCTNCGAASGCPLVNTKTLDKVTCGETCNGVDNCISVYSPHNNTCWIYGCSQVQQFDGRFTYRPSCSTECPSFALYELTGRQGSCAVLDSTLGVLSTEECVSQCLDIDGCLGITYRSIDQICFFHSCSNTTIAGGGSTTFFGLECTTQDCSVTYTQTCTSCKEGSTCVALPDASFPSPYECLTVGSDSPGTIFSVYEQDTALCSTYDCSRIDSAEGYNAYRKSCSQDCPNYKMEVLWQHGALGVVTKNIANVSSLYECQMGCLDTDECRGALYNSVDLSCLYYNSSDAYYDGSPDVTFVSRICNYTDCVRTEYQTCVNCKEHTDCTVRKVYATNKDECEELCASQTDRSCVFKPYLQQRCMMYDCSKVTIYDGYTTFRETCTTDCPYYKIEEMVGHSGTSAIMTAEWFPSSPEDCVNRCLDMEGCRGVTYQYLDDGCYYHNGANTTDTGSTDVTFYKRDCNFKPEPNCNKTYFQTCVNCKALDSCEIYPGGFQGASTMSRCSEVCDNILTSSLCIFGPNNGRCAAYYACGGLQPTEGYTALRKTCSQDCPFFKLAIMVGYVGDSDVIASDTSNTSYTECQERCFDMDGCRGVTFYSSTGVCTYHNGSNATLASGVSSEIFIQRDCDYRDCDRNFTRSCRRCKQSSTCGWDVWNEPDFLVDYNCSDWCRDFDNCTSASYIRRNNICQMKDCTEIEPDTFDDKVLYRESCTNDCPQFEIELFVDTYGNCTPTGDSGFDVIVDYQHCISRCLDITGCVATTFDHASSKCYFYASCNSMIPSVDDKFVTIICPPVEPPMLYTQKCVHCGVDRVECAGNFSAAQYINYTDCETFCDNRADCHTAVYDGSSLTCALFQCSMSIRSYGAVSFRKTYSSDCLEYEIRFYSGYTAHSSCTQIATSKEYSSSYCFSRCLDESACKGVSYNTLTKDCSLHVCNTMQSGSNTTEFIEKICYPEQCVRNFSQTCIDCAASTYCQEAIYKNTSAMPSVVLDPSNLWTDNITSIWYKPDKDSSIHYLDCHWLEMDIGHTLIRASCAGDCPWFEIFIVPEAAGTCDIIGVIKGGISLEYCLEQCLDTPGCLGATYNTYLYICNLHDCNNYTFVNSSRVEFINRRCIEQSETCEANVTQTCINCRIGNDCMNEFHSTPAYFQHECRDLKIADNTSLIAYYKREESVCNLYECKQVGVKMEHILYRQSCNQDCPQFELFSLQGRKGTCEIIGHHEGGLNSDYCIEKCIDLPGCLGTTFNEDLERCTYHNCTDFVWASAAHYFVKKVCVDEIPLRENIQTCYNCKRADRCQDRYYSYPQLYFHKYDLCFPNVSSNDYASWATMEHEERDGECQGVNCTFVDQMNDHYQTVRRKSYATDCPHFEVYKIKKYTGTCSVIGSDDGWFPVDYCITKCLDLEGCRGVTSKNSVSCTYHNCTDHEPVTDGSGGYTFVKRVCFDPADEPVRSHIQACINCDNNCELELATQNNELRSSNCVFTNSDSRSITYKELSGQMNCYEYSCDQPYLANRDGTILRKTYNTDCTKFEVHVVYLGMSPCEHTHYDEGIYRWYVCLHRCMDISGCRATDYHWSSKRCYYYNCTDNIPSTSTNWTVHLEKECLNPAECNSITMQRCLNCGVSTECQLPFQTVSSVDETICSASCAGNPDCDMAVLDTSQSCAQYQCGRIVTSHNGTEVYRPSCDNTDCPLFELYTVNNEVGTCNPYMVEHFVPNATLCMRRCMDLPNCRAITHYLTRNTCNYHRCDCSEPAGSYSTTFMWKYCLNDIVNRTIIPSTCLGNSTCDETLFYPREIIACDTTTTSTTTTTTTTTTPVPTTTVNITAQHIGAIFIQPCLCGTGEFINLSVSQIAMHMSDSIRIDPHTTSLARRLKISASDDRTSVKVIGGAGAAVLLSVCVLILTLDGGNWYKSIIRFRRIIKRIVRYCKVRRISSYSDTFNIIGEVDAGIGDTDGSLIDLEKESHNKEANKSAKSDKASSSKIKRNKYDVLVDPLDRIEENITSQDPGDSNE